MYFRRKVCINTSLVQGFCSQFPLCLLPWLTLQKESVGVRARGRSLCGVLHEGHISGT